jgi:hypothetical protein
MNQGLNTTTFVRNSLTLRATLRVVLFTGALCALSAVSLADARIKCWTNNEGVPECGNSVPPEFAQRGFEEKSAGGVTVDSTESARTVADLEAERRLKQQEAEAAALAREQAARDRVLLDTFSSEDDLLLARDGQIAHLNSQIKITESHIEKLKKSLDELIIEAADHERRGNKPPDKLVADIGSLREQIGDNERFIETKNAERVAIEEKFADDIDRFRKLKGTDY